MNKTVLSFVASLLVAGCGATTPAVLEPAHPASPDAAVAPLPPPSTTLTITTAAPTTAPAGNDHGDGHAGHGSHGTASPPAAASPTSQPSAHGVYTCPMHPEVVSHQPGSCPKCKMRLVKKEGAR